MDIVSAIIGGVFTILGSFGGAWFMHYLQTRQHADKTGTRPTAALPETPDDTPTHVRDTPDSPTVTTTLTPYLRVFGVFFLGCLMAFIWLIVAASIAYEGPDSPLLVPVIWPPGVIPIIIVLDKFNGFASVVAFIVLQASLLIVLSTIEVPSPIATLWCIFGLLLTATVLRIVTTRKPV